MEIKNLAPQNVWSIFDAMTQVPRPSKKEEKIRQWLVNWAKEHNIECHLDSTGNVLMRVPATPGYENHPTVVMQGHMDMVCEKNSDVKHDFENDPLDTYIDGDWVKARGTTLGADDGMGVALALGIMIDPEAKHGPLEALITYDEETGMTGANNLDEGFMTGKILVNIDSETEGQIFIGCAGGKDTCAQFRYAPIPAPDRFYAKVKVSGLMGGHSGGDIHLGHANANKVLVRFLLSQPDMVLASIHGGNLRNAIAREAELPSAEKKDSQGICFVGKVDLPVFLQQQLKAREGDAVEIFRDYYSNLEKPDTLEEMAEPIVYHKGDGKVVGKHIGAQFYTIGQRHGLNIGGHKEPLFVIAKDASENVIYLGEGQTHPGLFRQALGIDAADVHWIRPDLAMTFGDERDYLVRIRYRQPLQRARLIFTPEKMYIRFEQPQRGVTPGQFAAWYTEEGELLGSGTIAK